ncbi:hypothetical protein BM449_00495 [Synechococcus sp. SynAce01]|nr:hypothetical protein BM449_00495 [Synechococcus sp. SynAce01]
MSQRRACAHKPARAAAASAASGARHSRHALDALLASSASWANDANTRRSSRSRRASCSRRACRALDRACIDPGDQRCIPDVERVALVLNDVGIALLPVCGWQSREGRD